MDLGCVQGAKVLDEAVVFRGRMCVRGLCMLGVMVMGTLREE